MHRFSPSATNRATCCYLVGRIELDATARLTVDALDDFMAGRSGRNSQPARHNRRIFPAAASAAAVTEIRVAANLSTLARELEQRARELAATFDAAR